MTARIHENSVKGIFIIVLFILLILQTLVAGAQGYQAQSRDDYKGFVASFGTRSIDLSSSIEKLHRTSLMQAGGQVGLIFGNSFTFFPR